MKLEELEKTFRLYKRQDGFTILHVPEENVDALVRYLRLLFPNMYCTDDGLWYTSLSHEAAEEHLEGDWIVDCEHRTMALYDPTILQRITGELDDERETE